MFQGDAEGGTKPWNFFPVSCPEDEVAGSEVKAGRQRHAESVAAWPESFHSPFARTLCEGQLDKKGRIKSLSRAAATVL